MIELGMPRHEELTDEQWEVLRSLIPEPRRRSDGRGRPWRANREVLNGILWILRTGAPWKDLPERFPPYQTCHRRFQEWARRGLMKSILEALAADLRSRGRIDLSECFIDGSFASARGGGLDVGPTKRGKGTKLMAVADRAGLPVALHTCSASPHEVRLVDDTLIARHTEELPERLIGDKAYDSDGLDRDLALVDVEMIAPHRDTRRRKTQDGRPLRRYRRRWKVERLFAWLFNFRRLAIRYEYHAENYLAFVQLAGVVILLRAGL